MLTVVKLETVDKDGDESAIATVTAPDPLRTVSLTSHKSGLSSSEVEVE